MGIGGLVRGWTRVAALIAVAVFSLASAQSIVMQASQAAAGAAQVICTTSPAAHGLAPGGPQRGKAHQACPICAVAAHAPLCGQVVSTPYPTALAWVAYAPHVGLGPRGPPDATPRARGPPPELLTA